MWIAKKLTESSQSAGAQSGCVTLSPNNSVCAAGSSEFRNIPVFSPYGIESTPPQGTKVLLIQCEGDSACAGALCNDNQIQVGELRLYSQGGAQIILKNNGDIELNGVRITLDGEIIQKEE